MSQVQRAGVRGHYPPVQNEEGIALHKPVILVLSIIASIVAYKNVSEKNRKPIVGVILGAGLSYSVGLCNCLQKVASILEKDEEEEQEPRPHPQYRRPPYVPPSHGQHQHPLHHAPPYHHPPGQQYPPHHVPQHPQPPGLYRNQQGGLVDRDGYEVKQQHLDRPQMKHNPDGDQQQHGHRLDRPQQKPAY